MNGLVQWDEIEKQIDEARDLKTIAEMQEQLKAFKIFAIQRDGSLRTGNRCDKYRFYLEQNAGKIYRELPDEKGETAGRGRNRSSVNTTTKQHAEEGTGKHRDTLNRWAKEAEIPKETVEEYEALCNDEGKEFTSVGVVRYALSKEEIPDPKYPAYKSERYRIIYADPPWMYIEGGLTGVSNKTTYGNVRKQYSQVSLEQLCTMPLPETEDNAVLFLWVTWPFLEKGFEVIRAWGFKFKTGMVWDKVKHNFGYYVSVRSELLLICTKGSCTPDIKKLHDNVISIERTNHSEKPETFRQIIDEIYPHGKRIELFARKKTEGWVSWGDQI